MTDTTPKSKRRRWRWLVVGVLLVVAAMAWQLSRHRQLQAAWIAGVTAAGARVESPQVRDFDVKDAIGTLFLGKTTLVWIDDDSQLWAILAMEDGCPRGTHFQIISPASGDLLDRFRRRFRSNPVSYNPNLKRLIELEKNNPNERRLRAAIEKKQDSAELNDRAIHAAKERRLQDER